MTLIIGLTGGIGSGKTFVANMFAELGVPVYISDDRAKAIMEKAEVVKAVQGIFSTNVIRDNKLDRALIKAEVFDNKELLEKLNQIVHPLVKKDFIDWVETHQNVDFVIKETAILFEKGLDKECDYTIVVTAPDDIKIKRVIERDNICEDQVRKIMATQMSDIEKISKGDYIIENINTNYVKTAVKKVFDLLKLKKQSLFSS